MIKIDKIEYELFGGPCRVDDEVRKLRHVYYPLLGDSVGYHGSVKNSPLKFEHILQGDGTFEFDYRVDLDTLAPEALFYGSGPHDDGEWKAEFTGEFDIGADEAGEIFERLKEGGFFKMPHRLGVYGQPGPVPEEQEILEVAYDGVEDKVNWHYQPRLGEIEGNPAPSFKSAQNPVDKQIHNFYNLVREHTELDTMSRLVNFPNR